MRQKTFTIVPDALGAQGLVSRAGSHGPVSGPVMTTKQAQKRYREATRGPKLSKAEQRRLELAEQERIRKELESDKQAARARNARERKKAKEQKVIDEKKKKGLPLVDVHPSQDTISRFLRRGAGPSKKRTSDGLDDGRKEGSEDKENMPPEKRQRVPSAKSDEPEKAPMLIPASSLKSLEGLRITTPRTSARQASSMASSTDRDLEKTVSQIFVPSSPGSAKSERGAIAVESPKESIPMAAFPTLVIETAEKPPHKPSSLSSSLSPSSSKKSTTAAISSGKSAVLSQKSHPLLSQRSTRMGVPPAEFLQHPSSTSKAVSFHARSMSSPALQHGDLPSSTHDLQPRAKSVAPGEESLAKSAPANALLGNAVLATNRPALDLRNTIVTPARQSRLAEQPEEKTPPTPAFEVHNKPAQPPLPARPAESHRSCRSYPTARSSAESPLPPMRAPFAKLMAQSHQGASVHPHSSRPANLVRSAVKQPTTAPSTRRVDMTSQDMVIKSPLPPVVRHPLTGPCFKTPAREALASRAQRPQFLPAQRFVQSPLNPGRGRSGGAAPPTSTQLFLEAHIDDILPSPSQEARELQEPISRTPVIPKFLPSKPAAVQMNQAQRSRFPSRPAPHVFPRVAPKAVTSLVDPVLPFLSTQDLRISSQDIRDIETPSRTPPVTEPPAPVMVSTQDWCISTQDARDIEGAIATPSLPPKTTNTPALPSVTAKPVVNKTTTVLMGPPPFKRSANGSWTGRVVQQGGSQKGAQRTRLTKLVRAGGSVEEKHPEVVATQETNYGSFDESIFLDKHAGVSATQETDYGEFDEDVFLPLLDEF